MNVSAAVHNTKIHGKLCRSIAFLVRHEPWIVTDSYESVIIISFIIIAV